MLSVQKRRVTTAAHAATLGKNKERTPGNVSEASRQLADASSELARALEEISDYKMMTDSLEAERNFYYNKLRKIEILTKNIRTQFDRNDEAAMEVQQVGVLDVVTQVQAILYMTEQGFEVQEDIDPESF